MLQGIGGQVRLFLIGLGALIISTAVASLAGIYLGAASDLLEIIPGLMVLLPPSINMRGSISGVLASRLSTSMHLGAFEVTVSKESVLGENVRASFVMTVLIALVLGIFAYFVSVFLGIDVIAITDLVLISVTSGLVSGVIVMAITLIVAVASFRYGLDLDMIGAPTVTTSGDIVTIPILMIMAFAIMELDPALRMILFAVIVILAVACTAYSLVVERVRIITKEILPLLIPLSLVGTFAGMTYALDLDRLVAIAALIILIPPFMGGCGSIAGILCSRLATGMHMGGITPHLLPGREVTGHVITTYLYSLVLLPLTAIIAHSAAVFMHLQSPGLPLLLAIIMGAGLLVMTVVNIIAYLTASISFRYGLDPDNFGIPIITSIIDLIGAVVLIAVINIVLS